MFYFLKKNLKKLFFFIHHKVLEIQFIFFFFKLNFGFRGFGLEDDDLPLDNKYYDKYLYLYGHFGLDRMKYISFKKIIFIYLI